MKEPALEYYTVFCGVFLYTKKSETFDKYWQPWTLRLKNAADYRKHLQKNYYETYLDAIAPEQLPNSAETIHFTNTRLTGRPAHLTFNKKTKIEVQYFDIYLFDHGIGLYAFKVNFPPGVEVSYSLISDLLNYFRNTDSLIESAGVEQTIDSFILNSLEGLRIKPNWNKFTPHPKTYTIINEPGEESFTEVHNVKLFEIANSLPIGSYGNSSFAPSLWFYDELFRSNCISVFANWKAFTLFDSFTRLSINSPDQFQTWEVDYLNIYILGLYTKFQLYSFNSQLKDVAKVSRHSHELKNQFIEFVNDYNVAYVSYKFLPNLLYDRIRSALEIQKEIDQIEIKAHRLSEAYLNRKSNQLNRLIIFLSFLSIISVFTDVSDWLKNYGISADFIYSVKSALLFFAIPVAGILIYTLLDRLNGNLKK